MFGLQLSSLGAAVSAAFTPFSPSSLFAASEVGAWYDPSDPSTMFQDSVGTTPVTADGQPVGLVLDKSKGLVLGPELVTNGDFSAGISGWDEHPSFAFGTLDYADGRLHYIAPATRCLVGQSSANKWMIKAGATYKISFDLEVVSGTGPSIQCNYGYHDNNALLWGVSNGKPPGTYHFDVYATGLAPGGLGIFNCDTNGVACEFYLDNISVRELAGNHASQATAAMRPLYKTDGTYHWLQFDGVDDSLSTSAIDFTGTDKMFICAGSVSAPYVAQSVFLEIGPTYDSTFPAFLIRGCHTATNYLFCSFQDSSGYSTVNAQPINLGNVKTIQTRQMNPSALTIGEKHKVARINAVEYAQTNTTPVAHGGNWINAPLNIGRRNNASSPFTGNIYSLIVRAALSTAEEIAATEAWVNSKTGAY